MAQCGKCKHLKDTTMLNVINMGWCEKMKASTWLDEHCGEFAYDTKRGYDDELDEYLFENHQVRLGCCSSVESLKYIIAREVAEKMIEKFGVNIQYISQEERRKRMDAQYGDLSVIDKLLSNKTK